MKYKVRKIRNRCLFVIAILGVAGYFGINSFLTFGPESELRQNGEINEITQRYINENTEQYPQFLQGEHALGKKTFNKWCGHCHAPGAMEHVGTIALRFKYEGKIPEELEERTDLHPFAIKTFVRGGTKSMPSFRRTEISNTELDAIVNYLSRHSKKI